MLDINEPPTSYKDSSAPGSNPVPQQKPALIIRRMKPGTNPGGLNRRHAPLFQSRAAPNQKRIDPVDPVKEKPYSRDSSLPEGEPVISKNDNTLNPGLRLRALENAGKVSPPDQPPEEPVINAANPDIAQSSKPGKRFQLLSRGEKTRRAYWDVGSAFSLIINILLLVIVVIMAVQIRTLTNTVNNLLGGMFNNFVRMDNSVIATTINMTDVPIPLNFNLPVVQQETNVTLTQAVTIKSAHVTISTGVLTINNAPATVTLPLGTILPVSLQMNVPVQTTILVNLAVPVNIKLAEANSPDPEVGNLHTAFIGLQDTIGPLYCQFNPHAEDYLHNSLCNSEGTYIFRLTDPKP